MTTLPMDPDPPKTPSASPAGSSPSESDRPLPRRRWSERDSETVVPDNFVEELEVVVRTRTRDAWPLDPSLAIDAAQWAPVTEHGTSQPLPGDAKFGRTAKAPADLEVNFSDLSLDDIESPSNLQNDVRAPATGLERSLEPAGEQRHLRGEAPESVLPGKRFAVTVQVASGPGHGAPRTADLSRVPIPAGGREVAIDLQVRGGLRVLSDATWTLMVRPGVDSALARFELEATTQGPATVTLRAFALPSDFVGQLQFEVPVSTAATGVAQPQVSAAAHVRATGSRGATLEVDLDGTPGAPVLSFRLRGPGAIGVQPRYTTALKQSLTDIALGLEKQLDQLAKGTAWSNRAVEAILAGTGAQLWQDLLPASVQQVLLAHLDQIDSLTVMGANDPLPWELMMPVGPGQERAFLGDRVLITRWAYGAVAAPFELGGGAPRCFVLPDNGPPEARAEVDLIEKTLGQGTRIATLDRLLDLLAASDFGVLHFAAHNMVASGLPASAWVQLDQAFQQTMLGPNFANAFAAKAPLVFMNACNSSATSPLWVGSTGWAGRFLQAGAGAFVGSLWQVRDDPAKEFAQCFYDQLAQGLPLGQAFRNARQKVLQNGDPTRLGYTLFGNPDAHLHRATRSPP